jgi:hypothetical protein
MGLTSTGTLSSGADWSGGDNTNNTVVTNQPLVNPVSDNYPDVNPIFNNEFAKRNRALALFDKQFDGSITNTGAVDDDNAPTLIDQAIYGGSKIKKYQGDEPLESLGGLTYNEYLAKNFNTGGRVGLLGGGEAGQEQIEQMLMAEYVKYKNQGGTLTFEQFVQAVMQQQQEQQGGGMEQPQELPQEGEVRYAADGGRIGAYTGGLLNDDEDETTYNPYAATKMYRRIGKQEGGIMESEVAEEMIDMNGQEKDYRETGGFVNLGGKERADDVPARLSKNEFVFTADAVRAAGGGDIDAGSEVMQNMMDNLEQGGEISEESQGLEGAQAMYDQQQMLQSRIA